MKNKFLKQYLIGRADALEDKNYIEQVLDQVNMSKVW